MYFSEDAHRVDLDNVRLDTGVNKILVQSNVTLAEVQSISKIVILLSP